MVSVHLRIIIRSLSTFLCFSTSLFFLSLFHSLTRYPHPSLLSHLYHPVSTSRFLHLISFFFRFFIVFHLSDLFHLFHFLCPSLSRYPSIHLPNFSYYFVLFPLLGIILILSSFQLPLPPWFPYLMSSRAFLIMAIFWAYCNSELIVRRYYRSRRGMKTNVLLSCHLVAFWTSDFQFICEEYFQWYYYVNCEDKKHDDRVDAYIILR